MVQAPLAHEDWIDTFAVKQMLEAQRCRDFSDITGPNTPHGLIELSPFQRGVRVFRYPLEDGRTIAMQTHGDDGNYPVFLLHGTPSGLEQITPSAAELNAYGFQLVTYERPGYGNSTRKIGRSVADVAEDAAAIARVLCLDSFGVIGRSGGCAGALACAATPGEHEGVTRNRPKLDGVLALAAGVPPEAKKELDIFEGLGHANGAEAQLNDQALEDEIRERVDKLQRDPLHILRDVLWKDLTDADRRIVRSGVAARIAVSQYLATRNPDGSPNPNGYLDDELAARKPWEIDWASITVPVHLWAAANDPFCPAAYTKKWLAKHIPGAGVTISGVGTSHFTAMDLMHFLHAGFGGLAVKHARRRGKEVKPYISSSLFS